MERVYWAAHRHPYVIWPQGCRLYVPVEILKASSSISQPGDDGQTDGITVSGGNCGGD